MSHSANTLVQASITRRDLLKAGAKTAVGIAAGATLTSWPGVPTVIASSSRSSTTLSFLTGLGGPDGQTMQALVSQFNKQHPGITVKMQTIGSWTTFYDKLLPALVAGNAPEVFTTHVQEMLYFQSKGLFLQIDDLFGPGMPESDFAAQPMKYVAYKGHIYGMPLDMHGWAMYAQPTLLQKAGLKLTRPASGEEFIHNARLLSMDKNGRNGLDPKFDGSKVVRYGATVSWDAPPTFLTTLWSFGGNTISADGKKATMDTPQVRQALTFWGDLILKYHAVPKPAGFNTTAVYANNGLVMWPDGDWMRNWFLAQKVYPGKVIAWWMPKFGTTDVAWMSGHVISAPASLDPSKKQAVYTFMRWLSVHGLQWTEGAGHIPARISQRRSPAVMRLWPQQVYGPELADIGRIEQPNVEFFHVQDAYVSEVDAAWNGTKSISAAMSSAQARIQQVLSSIH